MRNYIIIIIALLGSTVAFAQQSVSGIVKDETGETLPGVTVLVKGTGTGTISDIDGNYKINDLADDAVLVFSFVGYKASEVKVNGRSTINVDLQIDQLEEVVVVGYGVQRKRDLTGSVASVSVPDMKEAPVANLDQALAGRVAGVDVSFGEGTPGGNADIIIRGGNSITGDNSPLWVIDGVPFTDFDPATLNMNDVKSVDILKDASATAIYGSRGANGVILVTTQQGRSDGKTVVTLSTNQGMEYIPSRLEVLDGYQYVKYRELQAFQEDGYRHGAESNQFRRTWGDPELYRDMPSTSWQDEIFREARFQNYNVSVSGGNQTTKIRYSGQMLDQEGTIINTGFNKFVNNLRVAHKVSDKLEINTNILHSFTNRTGVGVNGNGFSGSTIRDAIRMRPVEPIYGDGNFGFDPDEEAGRFIFNPVDDLNNTDRSDKRELIRTNLGADYEILDGLTLKLNGSYQSDMRRRSTFFGANTFQAERGNDGINGSLDLRRYQTITTSNTLNYRKLVAEDHSISVLGGVEAQQRISEESWSKNSQIPTDIFGIDNLGIGVTPSIPTTEWGGSTLLSYFGRANYSFKGKYMATVNFRADGSSKFRPENRWGYFPSFSLAWRVIDEAFLSSQSAISNLKFRGGWGTTGNNRISDFAAFTTLSTNSSSGYVWGEGENFVPGATLNNLGVPDLRWETTVQSNIGLDFGIMKDRIQGEVDVYLKRTKDLLLNAQMAPSTGFENVVQNVGEIENKGLEIALRSTNVNSGGFKWKSDVNISFNRNKVIRLNQGDEPIYSDPNWQNIKEQQYITQVGQPVGQIYGLQFDRIYQESDFTRDVSTGVLTLKEGLPDNGANAAPGGVMYIDQNGDGTINEDDRVVIGDTNPKHFGGFNNTFSFKGITLGVFLQWSYDFDIFNANRMIFETPSGSGQNGFVAMANMWSQTNTDTDIHTVDYYNTFGRPIGGNRMNDRFVEDGSFLRLKTVSLGYKIPSKLLNKAGIKSAKFTLAAQNLKTWTNYTGYDPEVSIVRSGIPKALIPNLDWSAYPQTMTVTAGLNLTF
ncbi:MAG: TonB-dependent receptor [Cyclobacteriaceae bacterium]